MHKECHCPQWTMAFLVVVLLLRQVLDGNDFDRGSAAAEINEFPAFLHRAIMHQPLPLMDKDHAVGLLEFDHCFLVSVIDDDDCSNGHHD